MNLSAAGAIILLSCCNGLEVYENGTFLLDFSKPLADILIKEGPKCLLVFFKLQPSLTKSLIENENLRNDVMVLEEQFDEAWRWKRLSPCFIGISEFDDILPLQRLLSDLPNKRLIALAHASNHTRLRERLALVDKRFYPPLVLAKESHSKLHLIVSCSRQDNMPDLRTINLWNETWKFNQGIGGEALEKQCNGGHHEMYGKTIVASVFGLYPRVLVLRQFSPPRLSGVVIDLTKVLAKQLGFTVRFKFTRIWGSLLPNGTLIGTRGDVQNGYADMGLEVVVSYHRGPGAKPAEGNMTNTNFWTWRVFNFLTMKPKQKPQWLNIMLPLDTTSWILTFSSFCFVSLAFTIISFYEFKDFEASLIYRSFYLTLMAYGIMYNEYKPGWFTFHGRSRFQRGLTRGIIVHTFWVVFAFALVEFYKSNLKASLMIKNFEPAIEDLQEALDAGMPVHLQDLIIQKFLGYEDEQSKQAVRLFNEKGTMIKSSLNLIQDTENTVLEKGGVGYFYDELMLTGRNAYHKRGEPYPLTFMKERYSTDFDGIVLPYSSPRVNILNPVMRRIYESGIVFKLYVKYKLDMTKQEEEQGDPFANANLTLGHFLIPVTLLCIGLSISIIIMVAEVAKTYSKLNKIKKQEKKNKERRESYFPKMTFNGMNTRRLVLD